MRYGTNEIIAIPPFSFFINKQENSMSDRKDKNG